MNKISLSVTKTLYTNCYRCTIKDNNNEVIGLLRVIPSLPLGKDEIPADAPEVPPFLIVIVDDADITAESLLNFEENVSVSLLERFTTETTRFKYCQFYYPSPAFVFSDDNIKQPFVC